MDRTTKGKVMKCAFCKYGTVADKWRCRKFKKLFNRQHEMETFSETCNGYQKEKE